MLGTQPSALPGFTDPSPAAEHGLLQRRAGAAPTPAAPSCCYLPAPSGLPCASRRTQGAVPPEGVPAPGGPAGLLEAAEIPSSRSSARGRPAGSVAGDHPSSPPCPTRRPGPATALRSGPAGTRDAPAVLTWRGSPVRSLRRVLVGGAGGAAQAGLGGLRLSQRPGGAGETRPAAERGL